MKIYVGNLPKQITDKQLHDLAAPFGKPDSAHVARWVAGGASKGFGFVEFRTAEEAQTAIAGLHGKIVDVIMKASQWIGNLDVRVALINNPKTPPAFAMRILPTLPEPEIRAIARAGTNMALKTAALRLLQAR